MSFGGLGTSDSKTKITAPNNSITTGDNATIYRDARRNQGNTRVNVSRNGVFNEGSTYNSVTNNGPGSIEIADAIKQALTKDTQPPGGTIGDEITQDAINRSHAQTELTTNQIKQPIKTQYLIYGALGLVALVAVATLFKHH
jgi:hypothetical protein